MYQSADSGTEQGYGQNRSGGKTVSDDTAEQVGNHTEYAEYASKNAHLHIGKVIGCLLYTSIRAADVDLIPTDLAARRFVRLEFRDRFDIIAD